MIRGIGQRGAIAVNLITMIGIGPLITIPLVLAALPGNIALVAWVMGAAIAMCDGLVWAELGSLYPGSGGTYAYLREAFGAAGPGRLLAFLFAWQTVLSTPFILASGYIGFAHYAAYLWPALARSANGQTWVAAAVGIVTLLALYRAVPLVARIGIGIAAVALVTLAAVTLAGFAHFDTARLSAAPHQTWNALLVAGLGPALIVTTYDYFGYGAAAMVGDEVETPARVLPRSIVVSVLIVFLLYVALQVAVLGAVPWQQLVPLTAGGDPPDAATYVASTVVERAWGVPAAVAVTLAILVTAFGSVYGNLLGASRVPYAAAADGVFLGPFARLHARHGFPSVSLLVCGLLALPACFLSLADVISALAAATVIIQNVAQIVALFTLRARGVRAPYRMWLFPLPALFAGAAWLYIFVSTGTWPIVFGLVSLAAGTFVYLVRARGTSQWPFAASVIGLMAATLIACGGAAQARTQPGYGAGAIVVHHGDAIFTVDGRPFFVYGAAFFYERLPRARWDLSMRALRALGINTLDLYVPWNWHETADGAFDFDGHSNPRRDLRAVLRLAHAHGFKFIVRPGPVVRNEWRNGGYPAWLLARPEYHMPLHDRLEGRYPPIATLQNAHSDDAAAAWMANATHRRYARRWLQHALHEFDPYAHDVLAIALDDDQGAYIDNQTWPAPHLRAYLLWLQSIVRGVVGTRVPTFINTYDMKVTASSPVWAMGNWYQSDAYRIGAHDLAQLAFSTGLLQTRPAQPTFMSEFQAGWLQQPADVLPRPAAPSNTALAFGTLLAAGVRGIVNFPAQDTLDPAGMEAPFANWSYAWDAALPYDLAIRPGRGGITLVNGAPRMGPTAQLGALVRDYGAQLAQAQVVDDAAIAYLTSAYDPASMTNDRVAEVAADTLAAQRACAAAGLRCRLVDLRVLGAGDALRFPLVFVVRPSFAAGATPLRLVAEARARLRAYARHGGTIAYADGPDRATSTWMRAALHRIRRAPVLSGVANATYARCPDGSGFVVATNADDRTHAYVRGVVRVPGSAAVALAPFSVPARSFTLLRIARDGRSAVAVPRPAVAFAALPLPPRATAARVRATRAIVTRADVFADGFGAIVLENDRVRAVFVPDAGARGFIFEDKTTHRSAFTSVGALRDDVAIEPPLSTSDRIAKYTHDFPAGFFNRRYDVRIERSGPRAVVRFIYVAPDAFPHGARFTRTIALAPASRVLLVDETATFDGRDGAAWRQRGVSVTSLALGNPRQPSGLRLLPTLEPLGMPRTLALSSGRFGLYDRTSGEAALVAWSSAGEASHALVRPASVVLRVTLARVRATRIAIAYERVTGACDAVRRLDALATFLLSSGGASVAARSSR